MDHISQKKLSFLLSIVALPNAALPKQVLQCTLQELNANLGLLCWNVRWTS